MRQKSTKVWLWIVEVMRGLGFGRNNWVFDYGGLVKKFKIKGRSIEINKVI